MNDTTIANAVISLGVRPDGQMSQQIASVMTQLNKIVTGSLTLIANHAAVVLGGTLMAVTKNMAAEVEKIGIAADKLNMPVGQMDAWTGAANMAGVSTETLIGSMDALHNAMVSAARYEGGGLLKEMMRGYMPQVGDMDAVEQYMLGVADAVKNLDRATAHRELSKIGIGDPKLQRWLRQGSDAIKQQIELSKKLGVISEEDRMIADRLNFAMRSLQRTFDRILLPVFRALAPVMERFALGLLYIKQHWLMFIPIVAYGALKIGLAFGKLITSFLMFNPVLTLIVTALGALGIAFEDLMVWMQGGKTKWGEFWSSIFGTPEELQDLIKTVREAWDALWNPEADYNFADFFDEILGGIDFGKIFDTVTEALGNAIKVAWKSLDDLGMGGAFAKVAFTVYGVIKAVLLLSSALATLASFSLQETLIDVMVLAYQKWSKLAGFLLKFKTNLMVVSSAIWTALPSILAIGALAGIGYVIYKNWDKVAKAWENFKTACGNLKDKFVETVTEIKEGAVGLWDSYWENTFKFWGKIRDFILDVWKKIKSVVGQLLPSFDLSSNFDKNVDDLFDTNEYGSDLATGGLRGKAGVINNDQSIVINVGSVDSPERAEQIGQIVTTARGRGNGYVGSGIQTTNSQV